MNYEEEIRKLKSQISALQQAFNQAQRNQIPIAEKVSQDNYAIKDITPYTSSKLAYIDDTECEFEMSKQGTISAWINTQGKLTPCDFEVLENKIVVFFDKLEETATVSISIQ